jgi:tetratricopeptide (TPR) repeat protein
MKPSNGKLKHPRSTVICVCILLIIFLSLGELIGKPSFPFFSQCLADAKPMWCSFIKHVSSNLIEGVYHIMSFAVLVFVFGYLYMRDIRETIKNGFEDIGKTISKNIQPVSDSAVKSLEKLAEAADMHNKVYRNIDENNLSPIPANIRFPVGDPITEGLIKEKEKEVLSLIKQSEYKKAEIKWIDFMNQHPKNIEIFEGMFLFYKEYHKEFSPEDVLKTILSFKHSFEKEPRFFRILATIYTRLRDISPREDAKKNAISAAKKSIDLDPNNPRWYGLLGFVNFWFGDIKQGIDYTEKALEKAEKQKDENLTMHLRNNLACYYASENIHEDKARLYSQIVYDYYNSPNQEKGTEKEEKEKLEKMAMGFDSVGYVTLRFSGNKKDEIEKSISYFNNALRFSPTRKTIMEHLQEAFIKLANHNK